MKVSHVLVLILITLPGCKTDKGASATALQNPDSQSAVFKNIEFITIELESRSQSIPVNGRLRAENRVMIFPEIQGKILPAAKAFKEGVSFEKGEVMLQLDSEDVQFQLRSSKSNFKTLISRLLPDIKMDFPESFEQVITWYDDIGTDKAIPQPPETNNAQLHQFMSSRGIYDAYYKVKSAESRLNKFIIKAPFNGTLSTANVEPGQVVGPQFHLGTLIDPETYILQVSMDHEQIGFAEIGSEIRVWDHMNSWQATIDRINPTIDANSQMMAVYLKISGENLKEGMFLEGQFKSEKEFKAARIPKTALLRTGHVYTANNNVIGLKPVQILDVKKTNIWVSGLENGDQIIANAELAYAGLILE